MRYTYFPKQELKFSHPEKKRKKKRKRRKKRKKKKKKREGEKGKQKKGKKRGKKGKKKKKENIFQTLEPTRVSWNGDRARADEVRQAYDY